MLPIAKAFADVEERALALGHQVARSALQRSLLLWIESSGWPAEVPDLRGGPNYRLHRWAQLTVTSAAGAFNIWVPSYEKVSRPTLRPVEAALGIRGRTSPHLQKLCASLAAELPFMVAESELSEIADINISYNTIRRLSLAMGATAREVELTPRLPAGFGEIVRVMVQMDGGRVLTAEGWREPRVATVEVTNAAKESLVFPVTGLDTAEAFWVRVAAVLKALDAEGCPRMAFISDGALWILPEAHRRYPEALCILDFYHAAEHIHDTAKLLYGEGTGQTKAWAKRYRRMLKRGRIEAVLVAWRRSLGKIRLRCSSAATKSLEDLIAYFEQRLDQVRYLKFRRRGFPIGSGRIEAAIKQIVNIRMKRNGAWWAVQNAEWMIALRAAKVCHTFVHVWEVHVQAGSEDIPTQCKGVLEAAPPVELQAPGSRRGASASA